ncbi:MAG: GNAT family N-acetyltransferase [Proteobacteria bacterium]|nr:GNAT family N-acetyltransferase [Pseudomonadota bacterium]MBI3498686.1 GNAT family N-acetyltransferase [Pseudomonadota bacterium]
MSKDGEGGTQVPRISIADRITPPLRAAIEDGLADYNKERVGHIDSWPLAITLCDPATGEPVGGLLGRTSLGLLFVDLLFLPKSARGRGIGRRIMALAEAEAKRRHCTMAVLYTMTFQAPEFYAELGYEAFGRVEPDPPGQARIYMRKRLG